MGAARIAGVAAAVIGRTHSGSEGNGSQGATLTLNGAPLISLAELREVHESWLPGFMGGPAS